LGEPSDLQIEEIKVLRVKNNEELKKHTGKPVEDPFKEGMQAEEEEEDPKAKGKKGKEPEPAEDEPQEDEGAMKH